MSKISAKVIADSKNKSGDRLTTLVVTFPRIILAELNTHRMFSRNSASSRAIPFEKMLKSVEENPFVPIAWQKEHKGMQGTEYFTEKDDIARRDDMWISASIAAMEHAVELSSLDVTKQLCNRLLEPFMWHTVIISATEWENFFALRCPEYIIMDRIYRSKKDVYKEFPLNGISGILEPNDFNWLLLNKGQAEIHIMALAEAIWDAKNESEPKLLEDGQWHIPFGDNLPNEQIDRFIFNHPETDTERNQIRIKVATARCARISYTVLGEEGRENAIQKDIQLHDRLLESGHMSPFEHCARVMNNYEYDKHINGVIQSYRGSSDRDGIMLSIDNLEDINGWSGNFRGFVQYRKTIPNENIV